MDLYKGNSQLPFSCENSKKENSIPTNKPQQFNQLFWVDFHKKCNIKPLYYSYDIIIQGFDRIRLFLVYLRNTDISILLIKSCYENKYC